MFKWVVRIIVIEEINLMQLENLRWDQDTCKIIHTWLQEQSCDDEKFRGEYCNNSAFKCVHFLDKLLTTKRVRLNIAHQIHWKKARYEIRT